MSRLKSVFICVFFVFLFSSNSFSQIGFAPLEDEIPFPIGSEVPFPWDVFEGDWDTRGDDGTIYRFKILYITDSGTKRVWVTKMSADGGRVLAKGSASVRRNRRVLHAKLKSNEGSLKIRMAAYMDKRGGGCSEREIVLTVNEYNNDGRELRKESLFLNKLQNLQ